MMDNAANGAGATPRWEYVGTDWVWHYHVPSGNKRAWAYGESLYSYVNLNWVRNLHIRACLTNTDSPAHHCGPAV